MTRAFENLKSNPSVILSKQLHQPQLLSKFLHIQIYESMVAIFI